MERLPLTISQKDFQDLYQKHLPATIRRFKNRGCSVEDAEDLAQNTYANACQSRQSLDDVSTWTYWLRAIERNVWRNHCRHNHTQKRHAPELSFDERIDNADEEEAALEGLLERESADKLHACVEQLPDKCKQVLTFFYFHQTSIQEISKLLHIQPNTVKTHLHFARKRLKELLAPGEGP